MNIFKIIKELYTGKSNLIAQLGIFSLIGIMIISVNQVVSAFTGNTIYSVFAAPSESEVIIFALIGIMLFIYFLGYLFLWRFYSQLLCSLVLIVVLELRFLWYFMLEEESKFLLYLTSDLLIVFMICGKLVLGFYLF